MENKRKHLYWAVMALTLIIWLAAAFTYFSYHEESLPQISKGAIKNINRYLAPFKRSRQCHRVLKVIEKKKESWTLEITDYSGVRRLYAGRLLENITVDALRFNNPQLINGVYLGVLHMKFSIKESSTPYDLVKNIPMFIKYEPGRRDKYYCNVYFEDLKI